MARETMAALIAKLRLMVNDPLGATQRFSDDQLQDILDANREDIRQMALEPADTIAANGATTWLDWFSPLGGAWETGATLQNSSWQSLTADSAELLIGVWHFNAAQSLPMYVTGRLYDLHAAAADVIELKMAQAAEDFDFSADGGSYSLSQKLRGLQTMLNTHRSKARVSTAVLMRGDTRPEC
jgi:hypothetical protein